MQISYKYYQGLTFTPSPDGKSWEIIREGKRTSVGTAWISRWTGEEKWCADLPGTFGFEGYDFDDLAAQVWEEIK